jgi:hypothetical protein
MVEHVEECIDEDCMCGELELFVDILKNRLQHKYDMIPLLREEEVALARINRDSKGSNKVDRRSLKSLNELSQLEQDEYPLPEISPASPSKDLVEAPTEKKEDLSYD